MDAEEQQRLLHPVVIGGGFSGVEVAGQIRDLDAGDSCVSTPN